MPHMIKKPLAEKRIFVQTPFSHSTLKFEQTISRHNTTRFSAPLPVPVLPKSVIQFDFKNHEYSLKCNKYKHYKSRLRR